MANLYKLVKDQQKEIKELKSQVALLRKDLELLKILATLQEKAEPKPYRRLGPYFGDPIPHPQDDWWKVSFRLTHDDSAHEKWLKAVATSKPDDILFGKGSINPSFVIKKIIQEGE